MKNRSLILITLSVLMLGLIGIVQADGPAQGKLYGKSYGEWSANWWQWAHSIPASYSPVQLEGDVDCMLGQQGPVYFLAGKAIVLDPDDTFPVELTGERYCSIPRGMALFFPLVNAANLNIPGDYDCEDAAGNQRPCTVQEKRHLLDSVIVGA